MTTQDTFVTIDNADLETTSGGAAAPCDAKDSFDAMAKVASGECTPFVHTSDGKEIQMSSRQLNGAYQKANARALLLDR